MSVKKRTQAAIDRSRKAASEARAKAAKATGAERAAYLKDAREYDEAAAYYVRTFKDLGVK